MRVFKIAIKFEQDEKWSERKADTEGYLIQKDDDDGIVEGYVRVLYPTSYNSVRYIKGLLCSGTSLTFMQMCNNSHVSPICYVFPNINEQEGYWSNFNERVGFFPVYPSFPCSKGHATVCMEEVTGESLAKIEEETSEIFEENSHKATWVNECLMADVKSLTDFLDEGIIFQMKLHCGKW